VPNRDKTNQSDTGMFFNHTESRFPQHHQAIMQERKRQKQMRGGRQDGTHQHRGGYQGKAKNIKVPKNGQINFNQLNPPMRKK